MSSLWEFLSDDQNRSIVQWLATGVASTTAAFWAVIQFFYRRPSSKDQSGPKSSTKQIIVAHGKGHAAGRDVRTGVSGLNLFLIVVFIVALAVILAGRYGERFTSVLLKSDDALPSAKLELSCMGTVPGRDDILSQDELEEINKLANTLYENSGNLVYTDIRLNRSCNACECERRILFDEFFADKRIREDNENIPGRIGLELRPAPRTETYDYERGELAVNGYQMVVVSGQPNTFHFLSFIFPRQRHLADRQYSVSARSDVFFDGVVVPKVEDASRYVEITLQPTSINDATLSKVQCIREGRPPTAYNRVAYGC